MKFGDRVRVKSVLRRSTEYRKRKNYSGREREQRYKLWKETPISERSGILIGFRTLINGFTFWENDVGYIFDGNERFKAALVVFSEKENPVFVPLSSISDGDI
jgi:hypothetical protein